MNLSDTLSRAALRVADRVLARGVQVTDELSVEEIILRTESISQAAVSVMIAARSLRREAYAELIASGRTSVTEIARLTGTSNRSIRHLLNWEPYDDQH